VAVNDLPFNSVNGEVHFCQLGGIGLIFCTVNRDRFIYAAVGMALYEMSRLYKHSSRATGRVVNYSVIWLDKIHNEIYQGGRRKEFTTFLRTGALHGELHKEEFINSSKDIAGSFLNGVLIK